MRLTNFFNLYTSDTSAQGWRLFIVPVVYDPT